MRYRVWLSLLAVFTFVPSPAFGDADLTLEQLRAKMAAASGTIPDNSVETLDTTTDARTSRTVTYRRGKDIRVVTEGSRIRTERGTYHGERWLQNVNGLTVIDTPLDDDDAPPPKVTLDRVTAPFDAYRIVSDDRRGVFRREYVDPTTFLLKRQEVAAPWGTVVTSYDSFQPVGRGLLPMHWTVDDRHATTTSDVRRTISRVDGVTEADVAEPPTRRALAEFSTPEPTVVPSTFAAHHVLIQATIAGHVVDLILDTGASGIVLDTKFARSIGLDLVNKRLNPSNAHITDIFDATVDSLQVGSATLRDVVVRVSDIANVGENGRAMAVGLLGFDFLATVCTSIDYEHHVVKVMPYSQFQPPAPTVAIPLPIKLGSLQPRVSVGVNGYVADGFVFDTGNGVAFVITPTFKHRHDDIGQIIGSGYAEGVGGSLPAQLVQIRQLRLGPIEYRNFVGMYFSNDASYAGTYGLIGDGMINNFNVDLDYVDATIYLTPNANARRNRAR